MALKAIQAIWMNGQIIPTQPVDWPEGTALAVEPVEAHARPDIETDLRGDDPESIERWVRWLDSLEPLNFTPSQAAALSEARAQRRDWQKSQFDANAERLKTLFE